MNDPILTFLFQEYGIIGIILFSIIVIAVRTLNISSFLMKSRQAWYVLFHNKTVNAYDILMSKLNYWLEFKIQNMYLTDPGRKEIFKDLMHIRFNSFQNKLTILNSKSFSSLTGGELYSKVVDCLHHSIKDWEEKSKGEGIPKIVIQKYKEWTSRNLEFALKAIEMICYSDVYGNNSKRMQAIYSLYTAMLELTVAEAEKSLSELNGELSGVEYKGYVCK